MSDENKPADDSQAQPGTPPAEPSPQQEEKRFTQAELDAHLQARLAKQERKLRKEFEAQAQKKPEPTTPTAEPDLLAKYNELASTLASEKRSRQFAEQLARHPDAASFSDVQIDILRDRFDPEDPTKMAETIKAFGTPAKPQATAPAQTPANGTGVPAGVAPQYQSPGAASAAPQEPSTNPLEWSKDDIVRLQNTASSTHTNKFIELVEDWRMRTEQGGNAVFRKRIPGA